MSDLRNGRSDFERQMLLVTAALHEDERGLDAWRTWSAGAEVEYLTPGEIRLLGIGWRGLRRLGADGPMFEVAGGVYRRTWYVNQLAIRRATEIIGMLHEAGVPTLAFKGITLALLNYSDLGARNMQDVDLLVHPEHLHRSVELVSGLGYEVTEAMSGLLCEEYHLEPEGELGVDLHPYALIESADDSDIWEAKIPLGLKGVDAWAPCPADSLLLVCAHGQRWALAQPAAWLVDAATLIRSSGGAMDWDRFADRAIARRLVGVGIRALRALRRVEIEVPDATLRRLEAAPVRATYRMADRAARGHPTVPSIAAVTWARYRRFRELAPPEHRPSSALEWLRRSWAPDGGSLTGEARRRFANARRAAD